MIDLLPHGCRPWLVLALVSIGNCGFWLFCFNWINGTGLRRSHTKKIEKVFIALCFLIPLTIAFVEYAPLSRWMVSSRWWPDSTLFFHWYAGWCLASFGILGGLWLESRRLLIPPKHLLREERQEFNVHQRVGGTPADRLTRFLQSLPGNQIGKLTVSRKELLLSREVPEVDGFRIAHLSDIHLTGQYRTAHHEFVLERLNELDADLIVITGDIIDYPKCLGDMDALLAKLSAPHGCFFVLGNHDRRLPDVGELASRIEQIPGFHDVGRRTHEIEVGGQFRIQLVGNERPWLSRHDDLRALENVELQSETGGQPLLNIAICHTPDQIFWAKKLGFDLYLAGHTHGGQVRFPLLGPIVAPSRFGSRFASGVFWMKPTVMHVSRGVAGTHPLRWRCTPEISLLTLRSPANGESSPPTVARK